MTEKIPRPDWLRVIPGGKEDAPVKKEKKSEEASLTSVVGEGDEESPVSRVVAVSFGKNAENTQVTVTPEMLMNQWMKVTERPPTNWSSSTKPELIAKFRVIVQKYTVAQLYVALQSETLWTRPSFVRALMDEVRERMIRGSFEPATE